MTKTLAERSEEAEAIPVQLATRQRSPQKAARNDAARRPEPTAVGKVFRSGNSLVLTLAPALGWQAGDQVKIFQESPNKARLLRKAANG